MDHSCASPSRRIEEDWNRLHLDRVFLQLDLRVTSSTVAAELDVHRLEIKRLLVSYTSCFLRLDIENHRLLRAAHTLCTTRAVAAGDRRGGATGETSPQADAGLPIPDQHIHHLTAA